MSFLSVNRKPSFTLMLATLVAISVSSNLFGQLGETREQLALRYGRPIAYARPARYSSVGSLLEDTGYRDVLDDVCRFYPDDLTIIAYFKRGRCSVLLYGRKNRTSMTRDELAALLNTGLRKTHWIAVSSDGKADLHWRTSDSSAFAYYFRDLEPASIYEGPRHALLMQTAEIDAIFKRKIREWYREHPRRKLR